jgi:hypothetical protein
MMEIIILSEVSQVQKDKCYMISLMGNKTNGLIEIGSGLVVTRGLEEKGWGKVNQWILSYS